MNVYLEENVYICDYETHFDALKWWRVNQLKYSRLSKMVCDILSIPITTVALESTFSKGGRVIDSRRASIPVDIVEMLLCTSDWLHNLHGLKKDQKQVCFVSFFLLSYIFIYNI